MPPNINIAGEKNHLLKKNKIFKINVEKEQVVRYNTSVRKKLKFILEICSLQRRSRNPLYLIVSFSERWLIGYME